MKKSKANADTGKRRLIRPKHMISLVVSLLIVCGASYAIVLYHTYHSGKAPTAAAEKFMDSIQTKSVADAYLQLCTATKGQFSETQFATFVAAQPAVTAHKAKSVVLSRVDGVDSAIVVEEITTGSGSTVSRSVVVTDQGGQWLVCGQPY